MLGGCHSHNASAWVRGHRNDYDNWAYQGCSGWGWGDVSTIFKKIEDWQGPPSESRGVGGPLYVAPPDNSNPNAAAFVDSGSVVGMPKIEDNDGPSVEGTSFFNLTIKNGTRNSVKRAYLEPAMQRENLTVVTHAEADGLILEGNRCVGVAFRHHGQLTNVRADREVILSCGVIGSPRLLLLSGIGPEEDLKPLGIPVAVNLPGVGRNLQDHPLLGGICYGCKGTLPEPRNNGAEGTLWWKSNSALVGPDIQPVVLADRRKFHGPRCGHEGDDCGYRIVP